METAYWRIRKMPKMLAMPGMMTPQYVLMRPISRMSRKSGSMATWTGTSSPADRSWKTRVRPRNRSLAKAYPAMELTTSDSMA
jgi:hypothetical protein